MWVSIAGVSICGLFCGFDGFTYEFAVDWLRIVLLSIVGWMRLGLFGFVFGTWLLALWAL